MNETLAPAHLKIDNLRVDLGDGLKLVQFLEVLAQKKIQTRLETKISTRIQKIQNLHIALKFLESEMGVKNPGCSAEGIPLSLLSSSKEDSAHANMMQISLMVV